MSKRTKQVIEDKLAEAAERNTDNLIDIATWIKNIEQFADADLVSSLMITASPNVRKETIKLLGDDVLQDWLTDMLDYLN